MLTMRDGSGTLAQPIDHGMRRAILAGPQTPRTRLPARRTLVPDLALELAPLRVNVVTPGLIDTPLLHTAYGAERDTIIKNRAGILSGKHVITAEQVAQVILMLMTNDYLTGEVVHVDGGVASCNTDRAMPYTIDGHTFPLWP